MDSSKSKPKGNAFENKIAKILGEWMFSDKLMLSRHLTSGAIKTVWVGDIVPQKQLPKTWNSWPFYIECKTGYGNQVCTFNNQTIVRLWIDKYLQECTGEKLKILLLIVNFKSYSTLFITNYKLNLIDPMLILIHNNSNYHIYEFKKILELNFLKCFGWG